MSHHLPHSDLPPPPDVSTVEGKEIFHHLSSYYDHLGIDTGEPIQGTQSFIASEMQLLFLACRRCAKNDMWLKERLGIAYRQLTIARLLAEGALIDVADESDALRSLAKNLRYKVHQFLIEQLLPSLSDVRTVPAFTPTRLAEGSEVMRIVC